MTGCKKYLHMFLWKIRIRNKIDDCWSKTKKTSFTQFALINKFRAAEGPIPTYTSSLCSLAPAENTKWDQITLFLIPLTESKSSSSSASTGARVYTASKQECFHPSGPHYILYYMRLKWPTQWPMSKKYLIIWYYILNERWFLSSSSLNRCYRN